MSIFKKKIAFSPIVAVQGARQTGKSVLVRDLLPKQIKNLEFRTFDSPNMKRFALENPESFLAQFGESKLVAIDEAQKVPDIFDAVKLRVDSNRRPGMYVLLGSTAFSTLSGIRESLTGRMTRLRVFPFTLAETGKLDLSNSKSPIFVSERARHTRHELMQYLSRGGLPGVFSVRSDQERAALFEDWLSLTCERDLLQLKVNLPRRKRRGITGARSTLRTPSVYEGKEAFQASLQPPGKGDLYPAPQAAGSYVTLIIKNLSPDIARRILETIPKLAEASANNIAHHMGSDSRNVFKHLKALEALFVVNALAPYPTAKGKPVYFLFDVGLADFLGASFEVKLQVFTLNEVLSRINYRGLLHHKVYYYKGSRGGMVHLVIESKEGISAVKILDQERLDQRELLVLLAWKKKDPKVGLFALGSDRISLKKEKIEVYPWEALG